MCIIPFYTCMSSFHTLESMHSFQIPFSHHSLKLRSALLSGYVLSCQSRVKVTPCLVYKDIRDWESIDHLCINPICRIGLIHMWSIDSHQLKWCVHINVLLNKCKHNTMSLSLLAGRTVLRLPILQTIWIQIRMILVHRVCFHDKWIWSEF